MEFARGSETRTGFLVTYAGFHHLSGAMKAVQLLYHEAIKQYRATTSNFYYALVERDFLNKNSIFVHTRERKIGAR